MLLLLSFKELTNVVIKIVLKKFHTKKQSLIYCSWVWVKKSDFSDWKYGNFLKSEGKLTKCSYDVNFALNDADDVESGEINEGRRTGNTVWLIPLGV